MVRATPVAFVVRWEIPALRRVHFWSMVSSYFVDTTLAARGRSRSFAIAAL